MKSHAINIVSSIIVRVFDGLRKTWEKTQGLGKIHTGLELKFVLSLHEGEVGYRWLNIVLFGSAGYIGVYASVVWSVLPESCLVYDEDGDECCTEDYTENNTKWYRLSYHDSCWRDALEQLLRLFEYRIIRIEGQDFTSWYKIIDFSETDTISAIKDGCEKDMIDAEFSFK
jgi:hypothetical protein